MLEYQKGTPTERGVYAVRVKSEYPGIWEDKFLTWYNDEWSYCGSDQFYRGEVDYFIGPLQRKMN